MTWFQGSLLSFLSVKAPSVKTPLQTLYNQLMESAARSHLLIHLLIHSLSKYWLKPTILDILTFAHPPYTNSSQIVLGTCAFPHCPRALGGADPTPASSGGRHLIQDDPPEHRIPLAKGTSSGTGKFTNQRHWHSILRLLLNYWESGLFFLLLELLTAILPPQSKKKWWAALRDGEKLCKPSQHLLRSMPSVSPLDLSVP